MACGRWIWLSQRVVSELLDVGFYERVGKGDDVDVVDEIMPLQPSRMWFSDSLCVRMLYP